VGECSRTTAAEGATRPGNAQAHGLQGLIELTLESDHKRGLCSTEGDGAREQIALGRDQSLRCPDRGVVTTSICVAGVNVVVDTRTGDTDV
jgi:hypothetical protein